MTKPSLSSMLASNRLFAGLAGATLQRIETLVRRQQAARGSTLFFQGDPGTVFYGIETGRVRMSAMSPEGREIHFVELGPGDTFGEIALLDDGPRTASAVVSESASLISIERHDFRSLLQHDNELCLKIMARLCERIRWTSELVEDLSFLSVEAQIAKRLWLLSEHFGTDATQGRNLKITQSELAAFLGVSRQAINTHLADWQEQGWLDISRGSLCIRDLDRLRQVAR